MQNQKVNPNIDQKTQQINHLLPPDAQSVSNRLLKLVSDVNLKVNGKLSGALNIRKDGNSVERFSTKNIKITPRSDGKPGIDVHIKPGTKGESVHIPVILTASGHTEMVYNDFFIGEGADITIVAGCAIHNCGADNSQHDGIHTFQLGKNAKLRYTEKHYGEGDGTGGRVLNPTTHLHMSEGSMCEIEMTQIEGVTSTIRDTTAHLAAKAKLTVIEKLLTNGAQTAVSNIDVFLDGGGSSARIISRSVAKGTSKQEFKPVAIGNAACRAHIQCDSIIMNNARVLSIPAIEANHHEAEIVHEAAIGRINSEQLIKLETLGLSEEEAEQVIINAFLE